MTCRRGWSVCNACHMRARRLREPPSPVTGRGGPGVPRSREVVAGRLEDFIEIRSRHYGVHEAAERLQISRRTAWRYEKRRREQAA